MDWVPEYDRQGYPAGSDVEIEPLRGYESNATGVLIDGYGKIDGPKPPFLDQNETYANWSMDWNFSTFRNPEACYNLPWLNAGCDILVSRSVGFRSDMMASRVSRGAIVTRQQGNDSETRLAPINATQVVKAFLKGVGIDYRETSPSLPAEETKDGSQPRQSRLRADIGGMT